MEIAQFLSITMWLVLIYMHIIGYPLFGFIFSVLLFIAQIYVVFVR